MDGQIQTANEANERKGNVWNRENQYIDYGEHHYFVLECRGFHGHSTFLQVFNDFTWVLQPLKFILLISSRSYLTFDRAKM